MKYHAIPGLMAAVLLGALPCVHADAIVMVPRRVIVQPQVAAPGSLIFCLEAHAGQGGCTTCLLTEQGHYMVHQDGVPSIQGQLSAKESQRILEEFEKLCKAAGEERFVPIDPRVVGGNAGFVLFKRATPYFSFTTAHGKKLELAGPDKLPPPELTAFMRILWQKLLFQHAKNDNTNYHAHPSLR